MRLGQLARKLNKKPQELVSFLKEEHQLEIESTLNTKVEGAALDLILESFKVKEVSKVEVKEEVEQKSEEVDNEKESIIEDVQEVVEEIIVPIEAEVLPDVEDVIEEALEVVAEEAFNEIEAIDAINTDVEADEITEAEILSRIKDGVIKAPKKELEGFKVVGKIELPSAKRGIQFLVSTNNDTIDVTEAIFETRKKQNDAIKQKAYEARKASKVKADNRKPKRRKITEADLKAHQAKRTVVKQVEIEKKRKEKKKSHYVENIQSKQSATIQVKKKKEIQKSLEKQKDTRPAPKNKWEKFLRWLNT